MTKIIKSLLVMSIFVLLNACSSDDGDSNKRVTYRISVGSGVAIGEVTYRDADGSFVTTTASNPSEWTKTISVEYPFAGNFEATITNSSDTGKSYTARIESNMSGVSDNGDVAAGATKTVIVSYNFN